MIKITGRVIEKADRALLLESATGQSYYITTTLCACDAKKGETVTALLDRPASMGGAPPSIFHLVELMDPALAPVF